MSVLSFAFCTRKSDGAFGLVRAYRAGYLTITFDDGTLALRPTDVTFI